MGKATSRTERESFIEERMVGAPDHYKTTIREGDKTWDGRGNTPEEAEKVASDKRDKSR